MTKTSINLQSWLPGKYVREAAVQVFKTSSKNIVIRAGETLIENVSLEVAEVTASVTVPPRPARPCRLQKRPRPVHQTKDATNSTDVKRAIAQCTVVRGPDGQIDIKGARSSQSAITVNSANVTDPVTGQFAFNLPIEAVESVQVLTIPTQQSTARKGQASHRIWRGRSALALVMF